MVNQSLGRKYVAAFGMLFSNIQIREWNSVDNKWETEINVPLSYGPKEKMLARINLRNQAAFNDDISITLPRMAFELTGISYDSVRALNKKNTYTTAIGNNGKMMDAQHMGVPYDYTFDLSVYVKKTEHGTQIIEQILPFFTPELNVTLNLTGINNIKIDVPIVLNSITMDDAYEADFTTRRIITWTLSFTMKAWSFSQIKKQKIIKTAITELGIMKSDGNRLYQRNTTIPVLEGKTLDEIIATDDYGFSTETEPIYE